MKLNLYPKLIFARVVVEADNVVLRAAATNHKMTLIFHIMIITQVSLVCISRPGFLQHPLDHLLAPLAGPARASSPVFIGCFTCMYNQAPRALRELFVLLGSFADDH